MDWVPCIDHENLKRWLWRRKLRRAQAIWDAGIYDERAARVIIARLLELDLEGE